MCCSAALILGWGATASASNAAKTVVPASFPATECLETVTRENDAAHHIAIGIPYPDVGTTPDEPPGSRHMQFFATCHDLQRGSAMPTWISRAEADAAALVDPTVVAPEPDDVLDEAEAWTDCFVPIVDADERLAISCEATADGVTWDTTGVPAGAYVVWGYTYEGGKSLWSRRPGIVHVVDDAASDPPAVAIASPAAFGEMHAESGLVVEGCAAGAPGTTLTLSWSTTALLGDDPEGPWTVFAELAAGPFAEPFMPPAEALHAGIVFRAEVIDPQGRSFVATTSAHVNVVRDCGVPTGGTAPVADSCGVAEPSDVVPLAPAVSCDDDGGSSTDDGGSTDDGATSSDGDAPPLDDEPSTDAQGSCRIAAPRPAWAFVLALIVCGRRRTSVRSSPVSA